MAVDRVTRIQVSGLRCLEDVTLDVEGLTLLVGGSGTGKSSLVEACRLLHLAAREDFVERLYAVHGLLGPRREPSRPLALGARIETPDGPLSYEFAYRQDALGPYVARESLVLGEGRAETFIRRDAEECLIKYRGSFEHLAPPRDRLLLVSRDHEEADAIHRMRTALERIEVHVPFEVRPTWASREGKRETATRQDVLLEPTDQLALFGANLANAYHALRNDFGERHWADTLEYVRLGLGQQLDSVVTPASAEGGRIGVALTWKGRRDPLPARVLSGGQLAYLAWVALYRLGQGGSLLAFDQPEVHLPPHLAARVVTFLRALAEERPVLLATHAPRLMAEVPEADHVHCELDEQGLTCLVRPQGSR